MIGSCSLEELLSHVSSDAQVNMTSPSGVQLCRRNCFFDLLKDINTKKVRIKHWEMDSSGVLYIKTKNEFTNKRKEYFM